LTEGDMDIPNSPAYADFPKGHDFEYWKTRTLPPLGKPLIPFPHVFIMLTPHQRCSDGLSLPYAESIQLPRGLSTGWLWSSLEERNALGSSQLGP
jgi:hypothetical protein